MHIGKDANMCMIGVRFLFCLDVWTGVACMVAAYTMLYDFAWPVAMVRAYGWTWSGDGIVSIV